MFAKNLREAMELKHMMVPELAKKMNMSNQQIYTFLNEKRSPGHTIHTYRKFANALGCSVTFLRKD